MQVGTPAHDIVNSVDPETQAELQLQLETDAGFSADDAHPSSLSIDSLWQAAKRGDVEYAINQIDAMGVDVNVIGPEGRTPLYLAAHCGHAVLISRLLAWGAKDKVPKMHPKYICTSTSTLK